ncbi:MAG: DUF4250 domain-containing protein [Lachnospiraceae bacterium]
MIPNDPVMLVSFLNLKLRDYYASFDALCEDLELDKEEIEKKLDTIDYHYKPEQNQFL